MIDATTSEHIDELNEYLIQLSNFHKNLRLRLGMRQNKSKKWAVWLLQGASLSLSRVLLNAARNSQREVIESNIRYSHELVTLIAYLNRRTTPASMARKWFDGEVWVAPTNTNKMNKKDKENEEHNQEQYRREHECHMVGHPEVNHRMSETLHPSYRRVSYSFMYNTRNRNVEVYSLVSNKEYFPKVNNYLLRLLIEHSAFALCNGDNVMNYSKEDYATLKDIHNALGDDDKYMEYAKRS